MGVLFFGGFGGHHSYVLGTQECSLDRETLLQKLSDGLGPEFILLHLQELQSIKLCIYARSGLSH